MDLVTEGKPEKGLWQRDFDVSTQSEAAVNGPIAGFKFQE